MPKLPRTNLPGPGDTSHQPQKALANGGQISSAFRPREATIIFTHVHHHNNLCEKGDVQKAASSQTEEADRRNMVPETWGNFRLFSHPLFTVPAVNPEADAR